MNKVHVFVDTSRIRVKLPGSLTLPCVLSISEDDPRMAQILEAGLYEQVRNGELWAEGASLHGTIQFVYRLGRIPLLPENVKDLIYEGYSTRIDELMAVSSDTEWGSLEEEFTELQSVPALLLSESPRVSFAEESEAAFDMNVKAEVESDTADSYVVSLAAAAGMGLEALKEISTFQVLGGVVRVSFRVAPAPFPERAWLTPGLRSSEERVFFKHCLRQCIQQLDLEFAATRSLSGLHAHLEKIRRLERAWDAR